MLHVVQYLDCKTITLRLVKKANLILCAASPLEALATITEQKNPTFSTDTKKLYELCGYNSAIVCDFIYIPKQELYFSTEKI